MQINLRQNYLYIFSAAVLFCIFSGNSILSESLKKGAENSIKRLGADLMIVSSKSENTEETLLSGSRDYEYFSRDYIQKIKQVPEVNEITGQFYLSSLSAECCSTGKISIIGFDPESDFLVIPWLSKGQLEEIKKGRPVCGSDITIESGNKITLYGKNYSVAGVLSSTGTSIDSTVYFSLDAVPELVKDAKSRGFGFISDSDGSDLLSTVFIKFKKDANVSYTTFKIKELLENDVKIFSTKGIAKSISRSFKGFSKGTGFVSAFTFVIGILVLYIINILHSKSKSRRYALLRICGASKISLYKKTMTETFIFCTAGCFAGAVLTILVVYPFGRLIGESLEMSFLLPGLTESIFLFVRAFVIMLFISVVSAVFPAYKLAQEDPYIALKEEE